MSKVRQIESLRQSLSWQAATGVEIPIQETTEQAKQDNKPLQSIHYNKLRTILTVQRTIYGLPTVIKSDNGPPYSSQENRRYLEALGIRPEFSTPCWPQGNAGAERFMQPLGKALKTAQIQGRPWQQELNRFLLQYQTASHSTTGVPPSELLFNRTVKGKFTYLEQT